MTSQRRQPPQSLLEWLFLAAILAVAVGVAASNTGCASVKAKAEVDTQADLRTQIKAELDARFELTNRQVAAIGSSVSDQQQQIQAVASKIDASVKNFDPLTMYLTVGGLVSIVLADRYLPLLATLWRRKPRDS